MKSHILTLTVSITRRFYLYCDTVGDGGGAGTPWRPTYEQTKRIRRYLTRHFELGLLQLKLFTVVTRFETLLNS